jgi:uncharacterized protein (TIGR02145 family)
MNQFPKITAIVMLSIGYIAILQSCKKITEPDMTTLNVSSITATSAESGGNVINNGGAEVSARGVCWSTSQNPKTTDTKTTDGAGNGAFYSRITGLTASTTYYVRAYAINSEGTGYGNEQSFETDPATLTDVEGNRYNLIRIGSQLWMQENLKATKYNDGIDIRNAVSANDWHLLTPAYCWLNNDTWNKNIYGALYNWYTVSTGKLCPTGWHIPSDAEWKILEKYLGLTQEEADATDYRGTNQGTQLKNTTGWSEEGNGTNSSGFSALPASWRDYDSEFMNYMGSGIDGYWWTSSENDAATAWARSMTYNSTRISRKAYSLNRGYSIRCVRDD